MYAFYLDCRLHAFRTQRFSRANFQSGSLRTAMYCVVESNWATFAFYGRGPAVP